jgi:hypothetical protein
MRRNALIQTLVSRAASGLAPVQAGRVVHDLRPPRQVAAEPY